MADAGVAGGAYLAVPTAVAMVFREPSFSFVYSLGLPTGVAVSGSLSYG
jgi:hypothetical protein